MSSHDDLPLADYDHLPLASLVHRVRTLDAGGVEVLLDYETAHGNRLPVTEVLKARLGQLAAGAEPSGGSPTGFAPEAAGAPAAPRQTDQTTSAPTISPPPHGNPGNPAGPR